MVFFVCEDCNETLKRLKVAAHLCKCSCSAITCVDCNKSFYDDSYLQHSTCMSEAERYEGHLYQAPKKRSAQDAWSDVVEGSAGDGAAPAELAPLLPRLAALDNVPRNEKKFKNFVGNSLNLRDAGLVARLWAYLAAKRDAAKAELLAAIEGCERGVRATDDRKRDIDALASALEKLNPNKRALRCDLINGEWELLYTTSASILGANRPWPFRPIGPIYQTIDARRARARNRETFPFFNAVDADLTPKSPSAADVQFVRFSIFGILGVDAPASARGALDTTYLDEELRVGRGDKGNLFVLAMRDASVELRREGDDDA